MDSKTSNLIFKRLKTQNPHPTTELKFSTDFELLIAVLLSAQATDISVNKATEKLFAVANTPESMLALGEDTLKTYIKTIGLFNSKAHHIIETCKKLIFDYQGHVPRSREALMSLPGVGRKTANVILNTAFGESTIAVDTHIFRLAHRLGFSKGKTPLAVEQDLMKYIDSIYLKNAHHWLILHGRYVCTAKKPQCSTCILRDLCPYEKKT
jgi:endonuclease III